MALQTATTALDLVFQPIMANELTPELLALDIRRDNDLNGIKTYIDSQLYRKEPAKLAAAQKLKTNFLTHGDRVDKLSYQQETAVVDAMLQDWSAGTLLAAVVELELTAWAGRLQITNSEFNLKYVERAQTLPQPAEIDAKRLDLRTAYDNLAQDVVSYSRVAAVPAPYLNIISQFNGLISTYNTAVHRRLSGGGPDVIDPIPVDPII